jgi:hypothetical protein
MIRDPRDPLLWVCLLEAMPAFTWAPGDHPTKQTRQFEYLRFRDSLHAQKECPNVENSRQFIYNEAPLHYFS